MHEAALSGSVELTNEMFMQQVRDLVNTAVDTDI
jgi:hypothetical protein